MTISQCISKSAPDPFAGRLRKYRNINTGAWLFGFLPEKWSASGTSELWTTDESQALADHGEVAVMLGLGSGEAVSVSMVNDSGGSGASATHWDAILEQIEGGGHASAVLCHRCQHMIGGQFFAVRSDGSRLKQTTIQ